jgi:hypothetical protein
MKCLRAKEDFFGISLLHIKILDPTLCFMKNLDAVAPRVKSTLNQILVNEFLKHFFSRKKTLALSNMFFCSLHLFLLMQLNVFF